MQPKKRKRSEYDDVSKSPYKNLDYICGSAAEVERLWSICRYVLTQTRSKLTPNFFKTLIFLKINHKYWDITPVTNAYDNIKEENKDERTLTKMMDDDDDWSVDEDGDAHI